ncbi:MAG: hypothetical protein ACLQAH_04730 [Limisphaerales bacterium]
MKTTQKQKSEKVASAGHRSLITDRWSLCLVLLLLTLATGCRLLQKAANVPGQAVQAVTPGNTDKQAADTVEVQQMLLRFADEYTTRMIFGIDKLRRGTNAPDAAEILRWKITLATESCSIASGPKPVANLLDMVIFVTVTRMALADYWQPKVFGESTLPLLESAQSSEAEIWLIAGGILRPEQQTELRHAITTWYAQNPLPESVTAARALGFASQVAETDKANAAKPGSVFSLLGVDPLAGMDPAVRELAQTRMLAERALFVTQKMPMLLRWQTELLTLNSMATPAVQQMVSNSTQIAASAERFAAVAEKLPGQVSTEREEILKALQAQEKDVASLMTTGTAMSTSLNTTLTTFDALMKRFGVGETNSAGPPPTNAEPFRIQDYTATAAQLEATARQLTELLVTLDQTLGSTNLAKLTAQVGPVVQQAQSSGKEIVNYAFWKGILLVVVMLLAALIYRFLVNRIFPKSSTTSTTK